MRKRTALVALLGVVSLVACGSDDRPADDIPTGVTDLVAAGPGEGIVVEGDLFASPARTDTASSMTLCDRVSDAPDVPDVPPQECMGERLPVRSDLDLYLLDLGWQSADGFAERSLRVEVTADYDGEELVVTEVRRLGEPVVDPRPDITDITVPRGEVDLCDRLPGTEFGIPPANSTYVAADGTEVRATVWRFDDDSVTESSGDVRRTGAWSCTANLVRMFGTGGPEAWLTDGGRRLELTEPDGFRYVEYD